MSEFDFKPLHPSIRTVPNREAPVLSEVLGISYEPPIVVNMDSWNKFIILEKHPDVADLLELTPEDLLRDIPKAWSGQYIFDYNCRSQWPTVGKRLRMKYHEEGHAVILQLNPTLYDEGRTIEEAATRLHFKEGLAEWASSEAVGTLSGRQGTGLAKWHLKVMSSDYQQLRIKNPNEDETEIDPEVYYRGHFFAYFAMRTLDHAGLTVTEGFSLMVQNPPTIWDQIKNAQDYAKSLV